MHRIKSTSGNHSFLFIKAVSISFSCSKDQIFSPFQPFSHMPFFANTFYVLLHLFMCSISVRRQILEGDTPNIDIYLR